MSTGYEPPPREPASTVMDVLAAMQGSTPRTDAAVKHALWQYADAKGVAQALGDFARRLERELYVKETKRSSP